MVWWMHCNPDRNMEGVFFGLSTEDDRVFQTINIMYECHDANYDGYDIHSLTKIGVNIFNIDMTKRDSEFFNKIKTAIEVSQKMPKMIPTSYYNAVGLSVTMSANDPIDIDDAVDIIILKDIMKMNQLREFKKINEKFSAVPILLWPSTLIIEDLNELIMISDGIVLDPSLGNFFSGFRYILQRCKQARKPVFYMHPSIIEDYYETTANDRQMLIQIHDIIQNHLDGIFLADRGNKLPIEVIQAVTKATVIIENDLHDVTFDYINLSSTMKIPVLQPYAAALAASLAALQSGASAIIVFTTGGSSARILSCASPPCRIVAITRHEKTARQLHLYRKVMPLHYRQERACNWRDESLARVAFGTQFGLDTGLFDFGAKLVVLAPSEETVMYCNSFQIETVAGVLDTFKCGRLK